MFFLLCSSGSTLVSSSIPGKKVNVCTRSNKSILFFPFIDGVSSLILSPLTPSTPWQTGVAASPAKPHYPPTTAEQTVTIGSAASCQTGQLNIFTKPPSPSQEDNPMSCPPPAPSTHQEDSLSSSPLPVVSPSVKSPNTSSTPTEARAVFPL